MPQEGKPVYRELSLILRIAFVSINHGISSAVGTHFGFLKCETELEVLEWPPCEFNWLVNLTWSRDSVRMQSALSNAERNWLIASDGNSFFKRPWE